MRKSNSSINYSIRNEAESGGRQLAGEAGAWAKQALRNREVQTYMSLQQEYPCDVFAESSALSSQHRVFGILSARLQGR